MRTIGVRPWLWSPAAVAKRTEAARVPGGHCAVGDEDGRKLRQPFEVGIPARSFVCGDDGAFRCGDLDDFVVEYAEVLRGCCRAVAAERELVLLIACNSELGGKNLRSHAKRGRVVRPHRRIDQAPTERCIDQLLSLGQPIVRPGQDERGPAHCFDTSGDRYLAVAERKSGRSLVRSLKARTAEAIYGDTSDGRGHVGQQNSHASDVPIVLSRLIGSSKGHVIDRSRIEVRVSFE
jgi:hypothetical protein